MGRYFGTDGIRGKAELFKKDFLAGIVDGLVDGHTEKKVLIGGDTRESTEWILKDLADALETFGVAYGNCGVLSTPAINYAFYQLGFDYAIDVTASHNPYSDNGIKIFERGEKSGIKLRVEKRGIIEEKLTEVDADKIYELKKATINADLHEKVLDNYVQHLKNYVGEIDFSIIKIGVDCANGATSVVGGKIFEMFGADVATINDDAEYGQKINREAGSTHIEGLQKLVTERQLDCGVAFDGDGDRCLMVDENGDMVDGDQILAILTEKLGLKKAVSTVAANQGLAIWAEEYGVKLYTSDVGDQNVFLMMEKEGAMIGGEQSGHIILPGEAMGDGILTGLMVMKTLAESKKKLSELANVVKKFPQVAVNIPAKVEQKQKFKENNFVEKFQAKYQSELEEVRGKLLLRPSGTEELIRIMVWGEELSKIEILANKIAEELKGELE